MVLFPSHGTDHFYHKKALIKTEQETADSDHRYLSY
jgi:hypothetical protein